MIRGHAIACPRSEVWGLSKLSRNPIVIVRDGKPVRISAAELQMGEE